VNFHSLFKTGEERTLQAEHCRRKRKASLEESACCPLTPASKNIYRWGGRYLSEKVRGAWKKPRKKKSSSKKINMRKLRMGMLPRVYDPK